MTAIDHPPADHRPGRRPGPTLLHLGRDVARTLSPTRGPSRFLIAVAALFVLSTVAHLVVWAVDGGAWSGPVSWRKPIVFSASFALLLWATAWLLDRLPHRPALAWGLAGTLGLTSVAETALIAGQTWRGRASHFNDATATDSLIFGLMGALVALISLSLVGVYVWSFIERPARADDRRAAWWGFGLIMSGLGIGQWLVVLGNDYVVRNGAVPEVVLNGEAGVVKFPHAIAFHGIQVFMVVAAAAAALGLSEVVSARLMRLTIASYVAVMAFSLTQAVTGRATGDLTPLTVGLLAGAGVSAVWAIATVVAGVGDRNRALASR